MRQKWVTFDCYGTLMDWQTGFRNALASVAEDRTDELVEAYHAAEAATEDEAPSRSYKDVLRLTLQRAAKTIGLPLDDQAANVLARRWAEMPIFPDTEAALAELRSDGWKLGVLTNCDDDLFERTRARFAVPIDMVVTAQQVGSYKPGLAHFEGFERRSGVDRARWVHAAVSWYHDMRPAEALGIKRVWVDREHSGHDASIATAHLHDLAGLPATLRSLAIA
jgi:2-haloacid dehalogenase